MFSNTCPLNSRHTYKKKGQVGIVTLKFSDNRNHLAWLINFPYKNVKKKKFHISGSDNYTFCLPNKTAYICHSIRKWNRLIKTALLIKINRTAILHLKVRHCQVLKLHYPNKAFWFHLQLSKHFFDSMQRLNVH